MALPPQILAIVNLLYGDDKWRVWAIILTVCLVFVIPKPTRRIAGFCFVGIGFVAIIWNWLHFAYDDTVSKPQIIQKKKYLH